MSTGQTVHQTSAIVDRAIAAEVVGLSKRFGNLDALDNVSIKIEAGSLHALLGENGAGKSTLVKCLMGFYQPTSGQIIINDRECSIPDPRTAQSLGFPCFGLDFGAVADIRKRLESARNSGTAILLLSEDLDEILELADRILVISGGAINYRCSRENADPEILGHFMAGQSLPTDNANIEPSSSKHKSNSVRSATR
ncbi:MAG: ATP-binding cassette domain-containing protein [Granulosicoccus sp.]